MMITRTTTIRRAFFSSFMSVCIACTMLVTAADAQRTANQAAPDNEAETDVQMTEYGTIDLAVQDTDLAQVLQMLSIQSEKNIITSRNVSATVTANLYDVTFHEALDSILRVNGYGYIEEGNFVYIYTLAELEEIERAQRRTESRIFDLEHLSAPDAREFVEPLLSDDGRISIRGEVQTGFKPDIQDGGADEYAFNAKIVVNDYPENLDAIAELIHELDTAPKQVLVEATVLRTTLTEDNAFGIDFSIIGSMNFTDLFTPFSAVDDIISKGRSETISAQDQLLEGNGSPATEEAGFRPTDDRARALTSRTTQSGGLQIGILHDNVSVFMRVLDEVTDTSVLARPKIMALNRQRAEVLVGEKIAYRSSTATETSTTQNVEFLDTGIQLAFRPFISRSGMIRMELQPKVSFAVLRELGDGDQVPDEFTNELTTNVRVRDGQTLVLGGLFQEELEKTRRQIPLVGDIPILGAPFRGHDNNVRRSEIIFLITPSIIQDDVLWDMGAESLAMIDSAVVGARAGLLPFSRERITNNYNRRAIEAMNRGDVNRAHYYINNSLRLKPNQPEMRRLRQEVTGARERSFERGILERVIRKQLGSPIDEANNDQVWRGQKNTPPNRAFAQMTPQPTSMPTDTASQTQDTPSPEPAPVEQAMPQGDESDGFVEFPSKKHEEEQMKQSTMADEAADDESDASVSDAAEAEWPVSQLFVRFGFPNFFAANQQDMETDRVETSATAGGLAGADGADQIEK